MDDDLLNEVERAFLTGFMDASSLYPRNNPYADNTLEAYEYDRGYTRSLEEQDA